LSQKGDLSSRLTELTTLYLLLRSAHGWESLTLSSCCLKDNGPVCPLWPP